MFAAALRWQCRAEGLELVLSFSHRFVDSSPVFTQRALMWQCWAISISVTPWRRVKSRVCRGTEVAVPGCERLELVSSLTVTPGRRLEFRVCCDFGSWRRGQV